MDITLDYVDHVRCKIQDHEKYMLACTIFHSTETIEGQQRKREEIFVREIKVIDGAVRSFTGFGYGLGDPAGYIIRLAHNISCKLKNVDEAKEYADTIDCSRGMNR